MTTQIFVNLPVKDLDRSVAFFKRLGFNFNPQFTDDNGACLVLGPNIYAMLLTEGFFKDFTAKPIANAHATTEVLVAIDAPSRTAVDDLVTRAVAEGGVEYRQGQDHGWMFQRCFADPDGHQWEVIYMDPAGPPQG